MTAPKPKETAKKWPQGASPRNGMVPPVEHRFKKGQIANPKGRPPGESLTALLRAKLQELAPGKARKTYKELIVNQLLTRAAMGEDTSIREVFDRADGKATQATELTGGITVNYRFPEGKGPG